MAHQADPNIRHKILTALAEYDRRSMRFTWDEDLWDAVGVPWNTFVEQLTILQHDGLVDVWSEDLTRPKHGRNVGLTNLGRTRIASDL